jgi:STE24 endopeptidase
MNMYLIVILAILIGGYLLDLTVELLNIKNLKTDLPEEFKDLYDPERYKTSQKYLKENTFFGLFQNVFFLILIIAFILAGGFNIVDNISRSLGQGVIIPGIIFAGILLLALEIVKIPFSAYHTFVIEEKYGFNKTTLKTFVSDILKSWILGGLIGGIIFASMIWSFSFFGRSAWFYFWIALTLFELFLTFIAPVVIMPLFNKFVPLEDGDLKSAVENYARKENFKMQGLFKMDGSKRSSKSNAFFTGFGRFRRIALFDTLIAAHTVDELVSVLAHEMGHYKLKHILKSILLSIIESGLMLLILSFFINNAGLSRAFGMENVSIYSSIFFFAFLYSPINTELSVF